MRLMDVRLLASGATDILYQILQEREGEDNINISHRRMPTFEEHTKFVESHPYEAWYLIEEKGVAGGWAVGSIYLTRPNVPPLPGNEIGIFIRKGYRGMGLGKQAVQFLMAQHGPRDYLANINPQNFPSIAMFSGLGFHHVQNTYRLAYS
jgi:RimJ/RimL family protein N-acetyltransferase